MPGVATTPYDSAEDVMQLARVFGNDLSAGVITGELLQDSQVYVPLLLNTAYEELADDLTDNGVETVTKEIILVGVPAVVAPNPAVQVVISYTGTNNGTTNSVTPVLPPDFLGPIRMWERPTGNVGEFAPMNQKLDGLRARTQSSFFSSWEWRQDSIYLVGALQQNDLRVRYNMILPKLVLTPQPSQVLILRSKRALAWKIVELFSLGREGAETFVESAGARYQTELNRLIGRTARRKQHTTGVRRIGFGKRRRRRA